MELAYEPMEDYIDFLDYVKTLEDRQDLCMICLTEEQLEGQQWSRYQLRCGHIFHTRCLRRWCGKKKGMHCSLCGIIEETIENRYCSICGRFGHDCFSQVIP